MALTVSFTASQPASDESVVSLVDTTVGTDVTITKRRVYLQKDDGMYLVPDGTLTDYIAWSGYPGTTSINIDALDKDYAIYITIQWLTAGDVVTYTSSLLVLCKRYADLFAYGLIDSQASNDKLITHANYYLNEVKLYCCIQEAVKAVANGKIASAQAALNRAKLLIDNPSNFY